MNSFDSEQFENELKRLRPAKPPQEILDQLLDRLDSAPGRGFRDSGLKPGGWNRTVLLRRFAGAGIVAALCAGLLWEHQASRSRRASSSSAPLLKADKVEIDRQLVADFDAVAKLPTGEPVRFRCEQWMDKVRWRDSAKGLVIEQTTPRLEIVPIRFETY